MGRLFTKDIPRLVGKTTRWVIKKLQPVRRAVSSTTRRVVSFVKSAPRRIVSEELLAKLGEWQGQLNEPLKKFGRELRKLLGGLVVN